MNDSRCGTNPGYQAHRRRNEEPCQPCKDTEAERAKKRYYANREEWIKRTSQYGKEHPEQRQASVRKWRLSNIEEDKERTRIWRENNPERVRGWVRARRARIKNNGTEFYLESSVLEVYGTNCHICNEPIDLDAPRKQGKPGWEKGLHIDHLVPLSKGGPDTLGNVRPAHGKCNLQKLATLITLTGTE